MCASSFLGGTHIRVKEVRRWAVVRATENHLHPDTFSPPPPAVSFLRTHFPFF